MCACWCAQRLGAGTGFSRETQGEDSVWLHRHSMKGLKYGLGYNWDCLQQWSPNFLAPGTGFVEDNLSRDEEAGVVQPVM